MTESEGPRRDPRRLFTDAQRTRIASRQHRQCSECGNDLLDIFHIHHVIPWALGGLTEEDNGVAVCPDCHLTADIRELPEFKPREWQAEATPKLLALLRRNEFATLSAAPGAGKTKETIWLFRQLADSNHVCRIVVFVPNSHLRTQWADDAKELNVFLSTKGTTEKRSYDGVVLTYHALSDERQIDQIIRDAQEMPTLFVLDEVHHLAKRRGGDAGAWAVSISNLVGTVDNPRYPTLNLSGTLFRSRRNEQITTIKYETVDDGQVQTIADYEVKSSDLIKRGQLRHIKVLGFDADMHIEAVDLASFAAPGAETIRAVDVDGDKKLRVPLLNSMIRDDRYLDGIIIETVNRLGHASVALNGYSVKAIIIADNIEHCDQVYAKLESTIGSRNAFIAHGGVSSAEAEIHRFRKSTEQAVMVGVQKFTEGFDVPDICVLTYLRTWRAPLFINQLAARAMRVTRRENELGVILPATIIVPNEAEIKKAFADILIGPMGLLELPPDPCQRCGRDICACQPWPKSKICNKCEMPWFLCECLCGTCSLTRATGCRCRPARSIDGQPDLGLEVVGDGEVVHVSIDGHEVDMHIIESVRGSLRVAGIPEVHIEQAAAAIQKSMLSDPMTFLTVLKGEDH
jgi:superfamily II DNA or RNA helicase